MSSTSRESPSPVLNYLRSYGVHETPDQVRLREETAQMPNGHWASTPEQAALMQQLIRLSDARHVLEVGTFTG